MHELSLAQDLVGQIILSAQQENAIRVSRVVVVIGALSGVERDAFEFVFPFAAEDSVAAGAELIIEEVPTKAVCGKCRAEFIPDLSCLVCVKCGSDEITVEGGREFLIRSIDLEVPQSV
jgi:hydrogenase nickel incorporation protein HypA/HybF